MAVTTSDEFVIPVNVESDSDAEMENMEKAAKALNMSVEKLSKTISRISADLEGLGEISSDVAKTYNEQNKQVQQLSQEMSGYTEAVNQSDEALVTHNETIKETSSLSKKMGENFLSVVSGVTALAGGIQRATEMFADIAELIEFVTDTKKLKRLEVFFRLISLIANAKGNTAVANSFHAIANGVEDAIEKVDFFKSETERLMISAEKKVNILVTAYETMAFVIDAAAVALVGLAAVRIAPAFIRATGHMQMFEKAIVGTTKTMDSFANKTLNLFGRNILGVTKAAALASPVMIAFGRAMTESDSQTIQWIGNLSIIVGILTGAFSLAILGALKLLADFAVMLGTKILDAMSKFEEKAQKAARAVAAFEFVIEGFGRTVGTTLVGSLEDWNAVTDDVVQNSTFMASSVQKSIKLLVAEGSKIGLTFEDTAKLLKRSADIASANGRDILDVTQAMVAGLLGQSQAAASLGIMLNESAVDHSEFAHSVHMTVSEMDDGQKTIARYFKIFEDSAPVMGAAAADIETVGGATEVLDRKLQDLQIRIGEQTQFTVLYVKSLQALVDIFLSLPAPIVDATSAMVDFLGVALKILGTLGKYALIVGTATTAYTLLNAAISSNIKLQIALNLIMGRLATAAGVTATSVTTLTGVIANLNVIILGTLRIAISTIIGIFGAATIAVGKLLIGLAPLAIKIAIIVLAVRAAIRVFKEITPQLHLTREAASGLEKTTVALQEAWVDFLEWLDKDGLDILGRILSLIMNIVKIGIAALLSGINTIVIALLELKKAWFDTDDQMVATQKTIDRMRSDFEVLAGIMGGSVGAIADVFMGTNEAIAASGKEVKKLGKDVDGLKAKFKDLAKGAKASSDDIKDALEQIKAENDSLELALKNTGATNLQIARNNLAAAKAALKQKTAELKAEGLLSDAVKKQIANQKRLIEAQAGKDIKQILENEAQTIEAIEARKRQFRIEELQGTNQLVEARKLQNQVELEAFDKEIQELAKKQTFREKELALINETREALKKKGEAELVKAGVEQKKAAAETTEVSTDIVSASQLQDMSDVLGSGIGGAIGGALQAFNPAGAFMAVASMITGAIQSLIDFGPQFLDSIANIFNSLTDLPNKLLESLLGVFDSIINFVTNFVGNLGNMITGVLDGLAEFLINLPDAFIGLAEQVPTIIENLVAALPEIAQKLIFALVSFMPKMMSAAITLIVKGLPRIISALVAAVPEIVEALVDGFVLGVKEAVNAISNALGLGDVFNIDMGPALEALEDLGDTVARSTSQIFNVSDLAAQARGLDAADKIRDAIASSTKSAANVLGKIWDSLVGIWRKIWNEFLAPIANALREAWLWIWNNIISPIGEVFKKAFLFLGEILGPVLTAAGNVLKPIFEIFQIVGKQVADNLKTAFKIFLVIGEAVGKLLKNTFKIFQIIGKAIGKMFSNVWESLKRIWKILMDVFSGKISIFEGIGKIFGEVFDLAQKNFAVVFEAFGEIGEVMQENFQILFNSVSRIFRLITDNMRRAFERFGQIGEKMKQALRAVFELYKRIGEAYVKGFKAGVNALKSAGQGLIDGLQKVWSFVRSLPEQFRAGLMKVFEFAKAVFAAYINGWKKILEGLQSVGKGIMDGISQVMGWISDLFTVNIAEFSNVFSAVGDVFNKVFDGFRNVFGDIRGIFEQALKPFKDMWDGLKGVFQGIFDGLNFNKLTDMFKAMWKNLNPVNILSKIFKFDGGGTKTVEKLLGIDVPFVAFSQGGMVNKPTEVPGQANVPGDSPLNDKILSLLSPGELVLPRSVMQIPGMRDFIAILMREKKIPNFAFGRGGDFNPFDDAAEAAGVGGTLGRILSGDVGGGLGEVAGGMAGVLQRAVTPPKEVREGLTRVKTDLGNIAKKLGRELETLFEQFRNFFEEVKKNTILGQLQGMVGTREREGLGANTGGMTAMGDSVSRAISGILTQQRLQKQQDEILGFQNGGLIPGLAAAGVDSQQIMAQPGEFVVRRDSVRDNAASLNFLNRMGRLPEQQVSGGDTTINVTINARTDLTPETIRREVVPVVEREFRRTSMRGKFIMSNSGIRENR